MSSEEISSKSAQFNDFLPKPVASWISLQVKGLPLWTIALMTKPCHDRVLHCGLAVASLSKVGFSDCLIILRSKYDSCNYHHHTISYNNDAVIIYSTTNGCIASKIPWHLYHFLDYKMPFFLGMP
jgi:hypothetical protein